MNSQYNLFNTGVVPILLEIAQNHKNNDILIVKSNLEAIAVVSVYEPSRNQFISIGLINVLFDIIDDYYDDNEEITNKCFEILMILGSNSEGQTILMQKINNLRQLESPIFLAIYSYITNLASEESLSNNELEDTYAEEDATTDIESVTEY
jgi:hypothetical protein